VFWSMSGIISDVARAAILWINVTWVFPEI
jgi:hypothetical protein